MVVKNYWEEVSKLQPKAASAVEGLGGGVRNAKVSPKLKIGTRVTVHANPASRMLYRDLPPDGTSGAVTTVAGPRGKMTYMPGPGGGLLYVQFDDGGFMGVSPLDLVLEGTKTAAVTRVEGLGGGGRRYPRDPVWINAKYPGVDTEGKPFKKGARVLYWPNNKTFMQGPKAEQAWRDFQAQIADEIQYNASFKKAESGDAAAYKAYFQKKLKDWGIKSPADLDEAKKKKFFDEVNDGWTSDDEKKGSPPPNADATCGCGCSGGARKAALNPGAKLEDLTREQQIVLWATYGFKPSYPPVGKHIRFYEAWEATGITQEEWGKAQKELVTHRVLASNGALTPQAKQLIKAVGGEHAQSALRKLAKSGWSNPSYEERSKMEDKLNAVN